MSAAAPEVLTKLLHFLNAAIDAKNAFDATPASEPCADRRAAHCSDHNTNLLDAIITMRSLQYPGKEHVLPRNIFDAIYSALCEDDTEGARDVLARYLNATYTA